MHRLHMTPGIRSSQAPYIAAIGLSARMLAQSARRAGLNVAALDIFGDRDTRQYAPLWFDIGGEGLSIDRQRLVESVWVADGERLIAHMNRARVGETQRREAQA